MKYRRQLVASLLITLPAFVACTGDGSADDPSSQEQETRIKPDGSDLPGRLRVVAPSGAWTGDVTVQEGGKVEGTGKLGEAIGPLSSRTHEVHLKSGPFGSFVDADVAADKQTTLEAAAVTVDFASAPRTLGLTELGAQYRSRTEQRPLGAELVVKQSSRNRETRIGAVTPQVPSGALFGGSYEFEFGLADGVAIEVKPGSTSTVKPALYKNRRVAAIVAPKRELPSAKCAADNDGTPAYEVQWAIQGIKARVPMPAGSAFEVGTRLSARTVEYHLAIPGTSFAIPLPLGETGAGPLSLAIGRLDVDDVTVKQADGSTAVVAGKYSVFPLVKTSDGREVAQSTNVLQCDGIATPFPTNTGVDLPRGRYRVDVEYRTTEAGVKHDVHDVDID